MHPLLTATPSSQGGVFTVDQARQIGYTDDEIRARLQSGRWLRVRHGIYRVAGDADTYCLATAAAVLACRRSDAVASHTCAAQILGLPLLDRPRRPELTLDVRSSTTAVKGCTVHRDVVRPDERDIVEGVPTTNAVRTVVDLARTLDFSAAVVTTDAALRRGEITKTELLDGAFRHRGRPRFERIRRVVDFASARSASPGESLARTVFAAQGLPAPLLNVPITVAGTVVAEVDFLWAEERTIGEFDGRLKYQRDNDRGDDVLWQEKLREEQLLEAGFEVVRVTWAQITQDPRRTAERVRAAFARQHRRLTG